MSSRKSLQGRTMFGKERSRGKKAATWETTEISHLANIPSMVFIFIKFNFIKRLTWNSFFACLLSTWTVDQAEGRRGCSSIRPSVSSHLCSSFSCQCWVLIGFIVGLIVSLWSSAAPVVMGPHYHRPRFTRMPDKRSAEHGIAAFLWLHDGWFQKSQLEAVFLKTFRRWGFPHISCIFRWAALVRIHVFWYPSRKTSEWPSTPFSPPLT